MLRRRVFAFTLLFFISYATADELPQPPDGFTWHVSENRVGTFLRPDGWFVREEGEKSDKAVFISKEDIAKDGVFTTGLSVNRVPRVSARVGHSATEYAKMFLTQYLNDEFEIIKTYNVPEQDSYHGYGLRYSGDNQGVATIANVLTIASDRDDTLYIIVFEAPSRSWDDAWAKGSLMLNMLGLGE
ncbi:MAG TPA: hypothetical protein VIQ22_05805 [Gammaproteobacteria bacterium]